MNASLSDQFSQERENFEQREKTLQQSIQEYTFSPSWYLNS